MDIIHLRDLEVDAVIGVFEWERRIRQRIRINLDMGADIRAAAQSDALQDTLDYKAVAKRILAFVEQSQYQLIETLIEKIAQLLLDEFKLNWVRVTVSKPGAVRGARDVGITIERSKPS